MARLWKEVESQSHLRMRAFLRFALTSIVSYVSLKQSYGGGGGGLSSTLYIASLTLEKNVGEVFSRKVESLLSNLSKLNELSRAGSTHVVLGSADIVPLLEQSVDYIFADPPFGSNIYYADSSLLWESWLGELTDETKEMVVSDCRVNGPFKTIEDYSRMMTSAFRHMFRLLKPGRWCTVEFSNSDGKVFNIIREAFLNAGFEIANMLLFDKTQKSFKQVKGLKGEEDVVDKDVVFNLRKPRSSDIVTRSEDHDLDQQVIDVVREHLKTLPARIQTDPTKYSDDHRTTATILIILMNTLNPKGTNVTPINFRYIDHLLGRSAYFHKRSNKWYLRGEAIGNGINGGLLQKKFRLRTKNRPSPGCARSSHLVLRQLAS